ncbi:GNAT family N-acetyltransferase [Lentiprolixibacter aurantiacus]|uniref:GNAT family N-acetyltransferase n=1 Tax=Lentiprolixibacter aurantiacus TaxID=2993939 RepID=A0AAE3SNC1_9FLAO|nr:GNAT family N-acetyltransferase [Lentiprolixibacter aurantiacus]MCX2718292.1 GNAT family N-acetyltransferase [Lentiprolixibacter aurantiacus]
MYPISYTKVSSEDELLQVLELQKANLPSALSEVESGQEGFVTVVHSLALLRRMNDRCPHVLAKSGNNVVGYALSMHPDFSREIDILKPMFREIEKAVPSREPYLIMGQICIDKAYRKQGIFRGLYHKMLEYYQKEYQQIITEVDERNQRSLKAHYSIGFKELSRYQSSGRYWHLIVLK